jgi:hypothetical protein
MSDVPSLRKCARCHVTRPLIDFAFKNAAKGWYRSYCRPCCSEYGKEHYQRHRATYLGHTRTRQRVERPRNRQLIADHLARHRCVDCGESDPIVLEFDHRDPASKVEAVARLVHTGTNAALQAEIEKCDVRCGNCHRRKTLVQIRSYRVAMLAANA